MDISEGISNMTLIKVDPGLLQSSGQCLQSEGQTISSVGGSLLGATQGAPSYDGQFGPYVSAIGQEAYSRLGNSSVQLNNLGTKLSIKGIEFQAVDDTNLSGIGFLGGQGNLVFINPGTNLTAITEISTDPYLRLGSLINSAGVGLSNTWTFIVSGANFRSWKGAVLEKENVKNWEIGSFRYGGEKDNYNIDKADAGVGVGLNAEAKVLNVEKDQWIGNKNFGVTKEESLTVGNYGGFVGYHDGELGAKVSADVASIESGYGLNIAGSNVGLNGKISLGFDAGAAIGKKGVKIAVPALGIVSFEVGLHIGTAIGN